MKIITTKSKVYKAKSGDTIKEIRFMILGFHFWTEKHFIEPSDESVATIEYRAMMSLKAERQVSFSEMSANLPDLSNEEFDKFQQSVYPTRF